MKIDEKIMFNIEHEANTLFLETFEAWKKANGNDLFVDDTVYNNICEYIPQEESGAISNKNRIPRTIYKLRCVQEMRENDEHKKYLMFDDLSQYVYNCFRTYFLAEILFKKKFTVKKILGLFRRIKLDINIKAENLNEFINRLLEV